MLKNAIFTFLFTFLLISASAATYYVATNGNDANPGTIDAPFASLAKAQSLLLAGDIVYIRGGVYTPANADIMNNTSDAVRAFVFHMNKSGTAGNPISYIGYPGERPVFDLQNIDPDVLNKRIIVFNVTGSYLHFKNFEIVGTRVLNTTANTQSECIRVNGGNNNIFEHLAMHDGKAIGFYLASGANNLVLNCDAYNNFDNVSGNQRGGNVDGFGAHADRLTSTGNVFRGCRAWYNSDDGFDLISCLTPVTIEYCWAFYNGYTPASTGGTLTATTRAGDGNGFKAGGFGMGSLSSNEQALDPVPMHTVRYSIAFYNGSNGFYANHHLGGIRWENNTASQNRANNYNFTNRSQASRTATSGVDVPGYGHIFSNNISYRPAGSGDATSPRHVTMLDTANSTLANNAIGASTSFLKIEALSSNTNHYDLVLPRKPDGALPDMDFYRVRMAATSFYNNNIGTLFEGQALPVDFGWLTATIKNDLLRVNWQTLAETNNAFFDVEASADGEHFQSIGSVKAAATAGSGAAYEFTSDMAAWVPLLGLPLALLMVCAGSSSRRRRLGIACIGVMICTLLVACSKKNTVQYTGTHELYIRIRQVDLDGSFRYSKVVKAIRE